MKRAIVLLLLCAVPAFAAEKPKSKPPGVVKSATFPVRHPIKSAKGVGKAIKHSVKWIWER